MKNKEKYPPSPQSLPQPKQSALEQNNETNAIETIDGRFCGEGQQNKRGITLDQKKNQQCDKIKKSQSEKELNLPHSDNQKTTNGDKRAKVEKQNCCFENQSECKISNNNNQIQTEEKTNESNIKISQNDKENPKTEKKTSQIEQDFDSHRVFRSGDVILNQKKKIAYKAIQLIGKGTFGQVLSVVSSNNQQMAMKIIKNQPAYINQGLIQIKNLREVARVENMSGGSTRNYINFYDAFLWEGHLCIVMELLDNSLLNILESSLYKGVEMKWIQKWIKQILYFLIKIHAIGIYHCDIKPQNIMFRPNCPQKPLLIDFSSSCTVNQQPFSYIQSRFYRSPQVILNSKPFTDKIDMWSLGCLLAELYLGLPLFPGGSSYDQISKIHKVIKQDISQSGSFIMSSVLGKKYFNIELKKFNETSEGEEQVRSKRQRLKEEEDTNNEEKGKDRNQYKVTLKSSNQYKKETLEKVCANNDYFEIQKLDDLISVRNPNIKDIQTHELFVDLVKKMLVFDPSDRISAEDAFLHPFVGGVFSQLDQIRAIQDLLYQQRQ